MTYNLSPFLLITLSILNYFSLFFFRKILFRKSSNTFFKIKIFYYICLRQHFHLSLSQNFFRVIWRVTFGKNVFIFWYSDLITKYVFEFTSEIVLWYGLLYLLTVSTKLSTYTFCCVEVKYLSFFKVLINLSATANCPSLSFDYFVVDVTHLKFFEKD